MPLPISHIFAFICINVVTDLFIWLVPFIYYPSNYVPQIDSPVPDQPNTGLMTYVSHPLITLSVPLQPTSLAPSGYFGVQPTSPVPLGYFDRMPELSATFEPPCGPTAYFDRVYTAIKRTDLLCPEGSPFPECLFGGNGGFRKSLVEFDWEANVYHSLAIRFIVGLLCDYMCRRIFTYLVNSSTSNRQVVFWDKMKRFFRYMLPRRLRDLVFQNPSPLQTVDGSTQTEPFVQGIDAYTQAEPFAQGVDVFAQAEPFVQTADIFVQTVDTSTQTVDASTQTVDASTQTVDASTQTVDTSTQTGVPELSSRKLPPISNPPILWAQRALSILRPRVSISADIRDRSRVFQLPEQLDYQADK